MMQKIRSALRKIRRVAGRIKRALLFRLKRVSGLVAREFHKHQRLYNACRLLAWMVRRPITLVKLIITGQFFHGAVVDFCLLKYGKVKIKNSKNPLVSIIIPVYNQFEFTYQCIDSINKHTGDVAYEIILADDVSNDATRKIAKYISGIRIIRNKDNLGFLKNCNNAAKSARGKYILFLNNDTKVTDKWLASLVNLIESDNTIGMVGSKLIFPDGRLQEAGGIITREGVTYNYGKFDDPTKPEYNYVRDVDYISGASILLPVELWNKIGGFDERYAPAYCEDSDLAFAIRKEGYRVVYQPASVVVHFEGTSNGTDENDSSSMKHYQIENTVKLQQKWKNDFMLLPSNKIKKYNCKFRDRIGSKGVVLFVDHYVPEYDKDAGSRTTYQYLKLLVKKGYLVKFLPDNFYNNEPYTSMLEQMGIEVLYGVWHRDNYRKWILENRNNIDIVYFNRPHITIKYLDFIWHNTDAKIIYYGHDLHFLREQREYELTNDPVHLAESKKFKKMELSIMKKADKVYYPSKVEEKLIKSIDKNIDVKAINAYMFDNIDMGKRDFNKKDGILFVGGFNHKPNVDAVMWFVENVYEKIPQSERMPFFIAGSNPPEQIRKLRKVKGIDVKGYISDQELGQLYDGVKLVVVPLRYGAGIKGKVVEAMSLGAVVVTTPVGAEGIIDSEKFLPITNNAEEMLDVIMNLYKNNAELERISLCERKYIEDYYSSERAWDIIKEDFINTKETAIIIPPDGFGSKGDEAMIYGALNLIDTGKKVKILTPRTAGWQNRVKMPGCFYEEITCDTASMKHQVKDTKIGIIVGADIIDGTQETSAALARFDVAEKIVKNGGECYIFCSFRKGVDNKIIEKINSLPRGVKFYLRDIVSLKNFKQATRRDCEYFPDLAYFSTDENSLKTVTRINRLLSIKRHHQDVIGVNLSETSFRSFYEERTNEIRKKYINTVLESIIDASKNPFLVLITHDTRHWDGYWSDFDYAKCAAKILEKQGFKNFLVLDQNLSHAQICKIIKSTDTLVTGRMHLAVAAFKNGVIPVAYTGDGRTDFSMNDKFHGMFMDRIGSDSLVIHDEKKLSEAIKLALSGTKRDDYLKHLSDATKVDIEMYEKMFNEINKKERNDYH